MLRPVKPSALRTLFVCLFSSALLILSFPVYNFQFLAWFGFVPLFFALAGKPAWKAALYSYASGILFWLGIIYWLIHVTLPGMIILVLYLALYFGIFGFIAMPMVSRPGSLHLLFVSSIWVLLEYLRSHLLTGLPWALLGHSQYRNLAVIQISDITGAWGVSFLVMMVNAAVYQALSRRQAALKRYFIPVLCLLVSAVYGCYKLYALRDTRKSAHVAVSVVQGNIPQESKWDASAGDLIFKRFRELSLRAAKDKPDLIIWPEAALPEVAQEGSPYYRGTLELAQEMGIPILTGAVVLRKNEFYNSAFLVSAKGEFIRSYDKLHLVPFGEYIPLRNVFPFLETIAPIGDITAGRDFTVFSIARRGSDMRRAFSVLICFEDLFPELSAGFVKRGAGFLVNITNDAWYKRTSAAYQHLVASVFRAVENRVYVVRSANTGVSAFIDPRGKIISEIKDRAGNAINVTGHDTGVISAHKHPLSAYTRFPDAFIGVCALFVMCGILLQFKNRKITGKPGN